MVSDEIGEQGGGTVGLSGLAMGLGPLVLGLRRGGSGWWPMTTAYRAVGQSRVGVKRAASDRWPDPTFSLHLASERDGEENIIGAYVIVNLPGEARRAKADAALAEAEAASEREAATVQRVTAEAASLYQTALAAGRSWQSAQAAARRLAQAADMTARAYPLGEGQLEDLLTARRQANEAALGARLSQLEALEANYRLRLDAHRLWDFASGT